MVFFTYCNKGYLPYTENLYNSLLRSKVPWKLLVVATDDLAYKYLVSKNIPTILYHGTQHSTEFTHYKHCDFKRLMFLKLDIIKWVYEMFKEQIDYIVYMDGDVWIEKDFTKHLNLYKCYDITFQCDEPLMKPCSCPCKNLCAGFMMIKAAPKVLSLFDYDDTSTFIHDQDYINKNITHYDISFTTFDRHMFSNGVFVNNIPKSFFLLHYNYIEGDEKKKTMQVNNHWTVT